MAGLPAMDNLPLHLGGLCNPIRMHFAKLIHTLLLINPGFMLLILVLVPCCILFSFSIATWAGKHKQIGFWWTFFFSLTLTPLAGWFMVRLSFRAGQHRGMPSFYQTAYLLFSLISFLFAIILLNVAIDTINDRGWICLVTGTGFTGMSIYLLLQATWYRLNDEE